VTVAAISESELKTAFTTAQALAARRERPAISNSTIDLASDPAVVESARACRHALLGILDAPESTIARFERSRAEYEARLLAAAERARLAALGRSQADLDRVLVQLASRRQAFDNLSVVDDAGPPRVFLDAPFSIWPTINVLDDTSHIEPARSWAKFRVESSASAAYDDMVFYFLWKNPSSGVAVINVNGYIVLNGYCEVKSSGGFFPDDRWSRVIVSAGLNLRVLGDDPNAAPGAESMPSQQALDLSCDSGGMFSDGSHAAAGVYRGFDLSETMMLVPAEGNVLIEVSAGTFCRSHHGKVTCDFASGGYEVICPGVMITTLT
jgi:hypothetical protein